jgi:hypothetical protein
MAARTPWWLMVIVAVLAGTRPGTAQERSPLALDLRGASDSFGPGLVGLSEASIEIRLTRPAHVVLFWIGQEGQVDLYYPLRSGDRSLRRAGRHSFAVGDVKSPIAPPTFAGAPTSAKPGRLALPGRGVVAGPGETAEPAGYWALLVGDVPLTAAEVQSRLKLLSREGGGPAILDRLPELLMVGRAGLWAAYYAPVAR